MAWAVRMLAGPVLWSALFSAVYALHGAGCAWGWPQIATPAGPLHPAAMIALWLAGLAAHGLLIAFNRPSGNPTQRQLIRAGNWIGAVASAATLLPVVLTSTCG